MVKSKPSMTGRFVSGQKSREEYLQGRIGTLDKAIKALDDGAAENFKAHMREYVEEEETNFRSVMNDWDTFGPAGIYDTGHLGQDVLEAIRLDAWEQFMTGAGRGKLVTERMRLRRELAMVRAGQGVLI